jgi:hypothetical protein
MNYILALTDIGVVAAGADGDADDVLPAGAEQGGQEQAQGEQGARAPGHRLHCGYWSKAQRSQRLSSGKTATMLTVQCTLPVCHCNCHCQCATG